MNGKKARKLRELAALDLKAPVKYGRLKTSRAIVRMDENKMKYNIYKKSYTATVKELC